LTPFRVALARLNALQAAVRHFTKLITTEKDEAYCLHINTIQTISISNRAYQESWTSHQQVGAITQDSSNINLGIEHNQSIYMLKGGNMSHSIATLLQMFQALAQKVKDMAAAEINENEEDDVMSGSKPNQHSILENLQGASCVQTKLNQSEI
jgi:hypothetical protein